MTKSIEQLFTITAVCCILQAVSASGTLFQKSRPKLVESSSSSAAPTSSACENELQSICGMTFPDTYQGIFDARMCLWSNRESLAPQCSQYLLQTSPSVIEPCFDQILRYCKDVSPGNNRIHACLLKNAVAEASPQCLRILEQDTMEDRKSASYVMDVKELKDNSASPLEKMAMSPSEYAYVIGKAHQLDADDAAVAKTRQSLMASVFDLFVFQDLMNNVAESQLMTQVNAFIVHLNEEISVLEDYIFQVLQLDNEDEAAMEAEEANADELMSEYISDEDQEEEDMREEAFGADLTPNDATEILLKTPTDLLMQQARQIDKSLDDHDSLKLDDDYTRSYQHKERHPAFSVRTPSNVVVSRHVEPVAVQVTDSIKVDGILPLEELPEDDLVSTDSSSSSSSDSSSDSSSSSYDSSYIYASTQSASSLQVDDEEVAAFAEQAQLSFASPLLLSILPRDMMSFVLHSLQHQKQQPQKQQQLSKNSRPLLRGSTNNLQTTLFETQDIFAVDQPQQQQVQETIAQKTRRC